MLPNRCTKFPGRESVWILGILIFQVSIIHAASGTEGAAFLNIPVGAGPAALGSAYTALANDAYAPVWNPAGLGFLESTQLAGQHLAYLDSIHYDSVGAVHPLHAGRAIGASVQYLGSGDIPRTDIDANNNFVSSGGSFDSHFVSYNLAYGQQITRNLALGLTGKVIHATIDDVSASAYAVDVGSLYQAAYNLKIAGVITNLGSKLTFINQADPLPLAFKVGAAYQPVSSWIVSGETVYHSQGLVSGHLGVEWNPFTVLSLRAGFKTDTVEELGGLAGFTSGLGIHVLGCEFAYAFSFYGDLGNAQYISVVFRFGEAARTNRNLIEYHNPKKDHWVEAPNNLEEDEAQALQQLLNQSNPIQTTQNPPSLQKDREKVLQ